MSNGNITIDNYTPQFGGGGTYGTDYLGTSANLAGVLQNMGVNTGQTSGQTSGDFFGNIGSFIGNTGVQQALGTGAGALLAERAYDRLGDIGERARREASGIASQGLSQTEFRPFTVTSATGGMFGVDPQGGTTMSVSPQEQALQNQLLGGAGDFFGQAQMPTTAREQAIFERMRAAQRPEEERQRLALEERLAGQGRLGVSSAAYGGATPEQLAMATAQEEARNRAMLGSMQQAQAEQAQQAALGQTFLGSGYMPQQALLEAAMPGIMQQELAQQGQQFGTGLFAETGLSGIEAQLLSEQARANLLGGIGSNVIAGLINQQRAASAAPNSGGGGSSLGGLFGDIVGGLGNVGSGIKSLLGIGG